MTSVLEVPKLRPAKPQLLLLSELDDLLGGVRECARLLGMSKANVSGTARRWAVNGFPREVARWRLGPGYLLDEVRAWRGLPMPLRPKPPKRIPRYEFIDVRDLADHLGMAGEIAELLDITNTQATTLMSRWESNGFPEPVWQPGMGSAYLLPEVWEWYMRHDRLRAARRWEQLSDATKEMLS